MTPATNAPAARILATDDNFSDDLDILTKLQGHTTNGLVSRLHIASATGNIGIGEANPAGALHITGPTNAPPSSQPSGDNGLLLGTTGTSGYKWIQTYGGSLALNPTGNNVGIGTNAPVFPLEMGSGAYCSVGGAWTSESDRNAKERFAAVSPLQVLKKVSQLPITEWQYKAESEGTRHIGPMAQDFHAAFGLNGTDDKHISAVDEGGVALAAIQGLNQKLETKNTELKEQVADLRSQLDSLQKTVAQLTAKSAGNFALNSQPQ